MAISATFNPGCPYNVSGAFIWTGTITLSTNYPAGGESLATIIPGASPGTSSKALVFMAEGATGYKFRYDFTNNKLVIFSAGTTEVLAGAYPGALSGDVIKFFAVSKKLD